MTPQSLRHEKSRPKVIVGIDFGSCYSAVSFTNVPKYINREPRRHLGTVPPSRLSAVRFGANYEVSSDLGWDNQSGKWLWGSALDDSVVSGFLKASDRLKLIKLCVEQSQHSEVTRLRVQSKLEALPLPAKEKLGFNDLPWAERLIALYLRELWAFARRYILRRCGNFDDSEVECWIGVPKYVLFPIRLTTHSNNLVSDFGPQSLIGL